MLLIPIAANINENKNTNTNTNTYTNHNNNFDLMITALQVTSNNMTTLKRKRPWHSAGRARNTHQNTRIIHNHIHANAHTCRSAPN